MACLSPVQAIATSPLLPSPSSPFRAIKRSSSSAILGAFIPANSNPPKAASPSLSRVAAGTRPKRGPPVVCAVGDVSAEGTNYLILGAVLVAIVGTAFPIFFSRKDLCPECDGAGFIRKPGATLNANAARKDVAQIVCPRCNGLGKLGQIDKV